MLGAADGISHLGLTLTRKDENGNKGEFVVDFEGDLIVTGKYELDESKLKLEADFSGITD